jgi:hypothetical protein
MRIIREAVWRESRIEGCEPYGVIDSLKYLIERKERRVFTVNSLDNASAFFSAAAIRRAWIWQCARIGVGG